MTHKVILINNGQISEFFKIERGEGADKEYDNIKGVNLYDI